MVELLKYDGDKSNLTQIDGQTSPNFSLGMPMVERHQERSVSQATLTEGKITSNKDSQPRHTTVKELANLGITPLSEANHQVNKPRDTQTQLKEQKISRQSTIGYSDLHRQPSQSC